jgi:hypothetical protein
MELGEVYKPDGSISYEKLFYFHFRKICNSQSFRGVEGNEIIANITQAVPAIEKTKFETHLFDTESEQLVEIEKVVVLFSEEILVSNANNLDYYYSENRKISNERLKELALQFRNY